MSENVAVLNREFIAPEVPEAIVPSTMEVEAGVNTMIAQIEEALANGSLATPEALANTQRDQKGGSGPDAKNQLYTK